MPLTPSIAFDFVSRLNHSGVSVGLSDWLTTRVIATKNHSNTGMMGVIRRLRNLSPTEFEHYVADLWEERGFETKVTEATDDMGIDVIATAPGPEKNKTLIQAKKYGRGNRVNGPEVRQYAGLYGQERNVDSVIVVTTSGFTSQAKRVGRKANVKLISSTELSTLAKEYDMAPATSFVNESGTFEESDSSTISGDSSDSNGSQVELEKLIGTVVGIVLVLASFYGSKLVVDFIGISGLFGAISMYITTIAITLSLLFIILRL